MKSIIIWLSVSAVLALTYPVSATQWTVSSRYPDTYDFDNIQDAVDAASDGDEIFVFDGTYTCLSNDPSIPVVNIANKSIALIAIVSPFDQAIIDGEGIHQGIICSGATSTIRIEGFIIQYCGGTNQLGGGLYCNENSPTIVDCSFMNNNAEAQGGGMYFSPMCNPIIEGCSLIGSNAGSVGGGMYFSELCAPTIDNCTIIASNAGVIGGGIYNAGVSMALSNTQVCGNAPNQIAGTYIDGGGNSICDNPIILVVDDDGPANFDNIQAAVDAANSGDEIVVMPGTYTSVQAGHIVLVSGKFLTIRSSDPNDPEIVASTIIDGQNERRGFACINTTALRMNNSNDHHISTNSKRVQKKGDVSSTFPSLRIHDNEIQDRTTHDSRGAQGAPVIRIQGFTIVNGYAAEVPYGSSSNISISGGGTLGVDCNVFISDCLLSNNAGYQGGAIGLYMDVNLTSSIIRCQINNNSNFDGENSIGMSLEWGGGVIAVYGNLEVRDTIIEENISHYAVGGIGVWETELLLTNCIIKNNAVVEDLYDHMWTGGLAIGRSNATIEGCTFSGNAGALGGALQTQLQGSGQPWTVLVNNCLFENNTVDGIGVYKIESLGAGVLVNNAGESDCIFTNCEFVNNSSIIGVGGAVSLGIPWINGYTTKATFSNCSFQGNSAVSGGAMWIAEAGTIHIDSTTFCDNTPTDIEGLWIDDGNNEFLDGCPIGCPDINGDGIVNTAELLAIVAYWGCSTCSTIDVNDDGIVDINDLLFVIDHWGPC